MAIAEVFVKDVSLGFTDFLIVCGLLYCLKILGWLWTFAKCVWRHTVRPCCQKKDRLYKMYGSVQHIPKNQNNSVVTEKHLNGSEDGSWAVVTGGSDGIGLAICKKLAKEGFNICIVSRTESKIIEKLEEIRQECRNGDSSFMTEAVVADFSKLFTIEDYRQAIGDKLKDKDIGILVLNAGYVFFGPYHLLKDDEVEKHMTTNVLHLAYTCKVLVQQLIDRYNSSCKKSAILITSSIMSVAPISGVTSYCASKIFSTYFGHALGPEL